jgi:hypothetical protein
MEANGPRLAESYDGNKRHEQISQHRTGSFTASVWPTTEELNHLIESEQTSD